MPTALSCYHGNQIRLFLKVAYNILLFKLIGNYMKHLRIHSGSIKVTEICTILTFFFWKLKAVSSCARNMVAFFCSYSAVSSPDLGEGEQQKGGETEGEEREREGEELHD